MEVRAGHLGDAVCKSCNVRRKRRLICERVRQVELQQLQRLSQPVPHALAAAAAVAVAVAAGCLCYLSPLERPAKADVTSFQLHRIGKRTMMPTIDTLG